MRVVILSNPISGRGTADRAAQQARAGLEAAGIEVDLAETPADPGHVDLSRRVEGAAALVVAGGDGTVRIAAAAAIGADVPLWHLPCGTANLFARAWGMPRDPEALLAAVRAGRVRRVDACEANGEPFVLMASIGYDAEIVYDLARRRGRAITSRSYLGPMWRQLGSWRPPSLAVRVDGEPLVEARTGLVVVANFREYMWGLNPATEAVMDDGLLDVVFFPVRSRRELVGWLLKCARRRHLGDGRLVTGRGRIVEITCLEHAQRYQLDGDPPAGDDATAQRLRVAVRPGALPVLCPA